MVEVKNDGYSVTASYSKVTITILDANFRCLTISICSPQLLESELLNHESQFELVCARAQELISSSHFGSEEAVLKKRALQHKWEQLKAVSSERNEKLNDSLQAHQVTTSYVVIAT